MFLVLLLGVVLPMLSLVIILKAAIEITCVFCLICVHSVTPLPSLFFKSQWDIIVSAQSAAGLVLNSWFNDVVPLNLHSGSKCLFFMSTNAISTGVETVFLAGGRGANDLQAELQRSCVPVGERSSGSVITAALHHCECPDRSFST